MFYGRSVKEEMSQKPDGRFHGTGSRREMFYGPCARKCDQRFITNIDKAFEFYRVKVLMYIK